ncbi:hypothetical protein HF086_014947 [Spodoptera exigua]|uniref:CRAL-TRIO domain-containing protein n=1 Tax=Spodoptera exigua TaxID=7107 RepID=A0A922SHN4_SPOEX|nr:hypothetical protein HF086_014947 [Spodoptera exigua]
MVRYEQFRRENAYLYDCDPFNLVLVKDVYAGVLPESPDHGRIILMSEIRDAVQCTVCLNHYDFPCAGITEAGYRRLGDRKAVWKCSACKIGASSPNPTGKVVGGAGMTSGELDSIHLELKKLAEQMASLPQLISKVQMIQNDLTELKSMKDEMFEVKKSLTFVHTSIDQFTDKIAEIDHEIQTMQKTKEDITRLEQRLERIEVSIRDNEQRSRLNNVEIKGVPYNSHKNTNDRILDLVLSNNYLDVAKCSEPLVSEDPHHVSLSINFDFVEYHNMLPTQPRLKFLFDLANYEIISKELDTFDWNNDLVQGTVEDATTLFLFPGRWDVDAAAIEEVVRYALVMDEIAIMQPKLQILGVTIVVDLDGLNLRQVSQLTPTVAGQIVSLMGVSFPLPNHNLHIIRYNWILHSIFYLFKQFMPRAVWNRIHFHGNDLNSLHKHIDPMYLPPELGGRCRHVISTEKWLSKINEYKDDFLVQELKELGFNVKCKETKKSQHLNKYIIS